MLRILALWLVFLPTLVFSLAGILAEYVTNAARRWEAWVTEHLLDR